MQGARRRVRKILTLQYATLFKDFVYYCKKRIFVDYFEIISLHLNPVDHKILSKKSYNKPEVSRVILDNSISLVMMTTVPGNPPPRSGGSKGNDEPFQSPFGDKPFG